MYILTNILDLTHDSGTRLSYCVYYAPLSCDRWLYAWLFKRWGKIGSPPWKMKLVMLLYFTACLRKGTSFNVVSFPNLNYTWFNVLSGSNTGCGLSRTSFPPGAGIARGEAGLIFQQPQSTFSLPLRWYKNDVQYRHDLHLLLYSSSYRGNPEGILKAGRGN